MCGNGVSALFLFLLSLACLEEIQGKICWKECTDVGHISSADIEGCHRRTGKAGRIPKFRCEDMEGPPCTVVRGETVNLKLNFRPGRVLKNVTQGAYWESGFGMNIPWAGLSSDACKFMIDNVGCVDNEVKETQDFSYPIVINEMYPSGTFNLRWEFHSLNEQGAIDPLGCFRYTIRIV